MKLVLSSGVQKLRRTTNKLEVVIPANGITQETAESGAFTVVSLKFH